MLNKPFNYGKLFEAVQNRPLPDWAEEIGGKTWAQFFLKYVVSHFHSLCRESVRARLPDAAMRRRMEQLAADFPPGGSGRVLDAFR